MLGNERTGIPPDAVDLLDAAVEIPMVGTGGSLNVAVAGSLVLYRLAGLTLALMGESFAARPRAALAVPRPVELAGLGLG